MSPARAPWVSVDQMREVDRLMVEQLGISLVRMMENAGRSLAVVGRRMLGGGARGRRVLVLAGPGGNGGGGLVAARHLPNAGALVDVRLAVRPDDVRGAAAEQLAILGTMGVAARHAPADEAGGADLVVDALLGYGQQGPPRDEIARLIRATAGRRTLALDVPTGLDPDVGTPWRPAVRADVTLTLAAPKNGLGVAAAHAFVGQLLVADISVPPAVWERVGAGSPAWSGLFDESPIVEAAPTPG